MKRPKTHPKTGHSIVPVGFRRDGRAIWPILGASPDDPAGGDGGGDGGGDPNAGTGGGDGKTFTQADLTRVAAKEKSEGRAAAEKAIAEQLGCTIEEAKATLAKARETEDKTKSEAEKDREQAAKERAEAEKVKREAQADRHAALIDRALAKVEFTGDEAASKRVHGMVTIEVGGSFEDILADVQELQKTLNPELFGKKPDGKGGKGRLPNSDPPGSPPAPKGGDDAFAAGQKRFEERKARRVGFNPLAKKTG